MNKKGLLILFVAMLTILLFGCTLARAELATEPITQDRFVGVYLIREIDGLELEPNDYWIEDGTDAAELDSVELDIPRMILPGIYDGEKHCYRFPGVEGYALFTAEVKDEKGNYSVTCSDLQDVNTKTHTHAEDMDVSQSWDGVDSTAGTGEGYTDYELSGTLYMTPVLQDSIWKLAHVYQKEDGTVYLDGTGDCYSFGSLGASVSVKEEATRTINGRTIECGTTEVKVSFEEVKEVEAVNIYWYGVGGVLLSTEAIDIDNVEKLRWKADASWMVMEEVFAGETRHTAYEKGTVDAPITLRFTIVNAAGIGEVKLVEVAQ